MGRPRDAQTDARRRAGDDHDLPIERRHRSLAPYSPCAVIVSRRSDGESRAPGPRRSWSPPRRRPPKLPTMRYWINTVSRAHVLTGVGGGFTQANHGRATGLRRLAFGDLI